MSDHTKVFIKRILGGTRLDSQGECFTKEDLERYCSKAQGRQYLHTEHDMALEPSGFVENLRVVPAEEVDGEWNLVGDVTVLSGTVTDAMKGFSISLTQRVITREDSDAGIFLPYPFYNDADYLEDFAADKNLDVGKWIKKSADPTIWALLLMGVGGAGSWLFQRFSDALFDEFFKRKVSPRLGEILDQTQPKLIKNGIHLQMTVPVPIDGKIIEIRIIPSTEGSVGLTEEYVRDALRLANDAVLEKQIHPGNLQRIVVGYRKDGTVAEVLRMDKRLDIEA